MKNVHAMSLEKAFVNYILERLVVRKPSSKGRPDMKIDFSKFNQEKSHDRIEVTSYEIIDALRIAYDMGHNDTVEGRYTDPTEIAEDIYMELFGDGTMEVSHIAVRETIDEE